MCGCVPGQTLIGQRVIAAVERAAATKPIGTLELKGFARPVPAFEVLRLEEPDGPSSTSVA
jgi:adenylate cyclase